MTPEDSCRDMLRKKVPELSPYGFLYFPLRFSDEDIKAVRLCMAWIRDHTKPLKTIRSDSSYHLKHLVEHTTGSYIPSGAFTAAAVLMGFKYDRHGPNAFFNFAVRNKKRWGY